MNKSFYNLPRFLMGLFSVLCFFSVSLGTYAYDLKEYFPLHVGDNRLYFETGSENAGSGYDLIREPISMTDSIQGVETFILGELSGDCWNKEYEAMAWDHEGLKYYQVTECDDGVYEVIDFDRPALVAPRHLELGEKKIWTTPFGDESVTMQMTLEAVEDVTVFPNTVLNRTFKNSLRLLRQAATEECRMWFAKDIGLIKEECTGTDNGETFNESSQLMAARVGDSLIGSPLRVWQGEMFSFYLSQITTSGCDLVMDNIVIALEDKAPEFWWIKFTLDLEVEPPAWKIIDFGQGAPPRLSSQTVTACPIPGLDFSQALHRINIDNVTLEPQLWMSLPFNDQKFKLYFNFPVEKLSWELYFLDLLK